MDKVYIVKGVKGHTDAYSVCTTKKLAEEHALAMLGQGYVVLILETPLDKGH